ncbi:SpoIID/LytB domain-containing protein [Candidatus Marinimicrobia bacterium]|nr:SpoIID/LytB domain-containing protein [Candidatus Neomarinimicrobiota bacterium]
MLVKGQIPNKEPIVSIGLVLPEDQIQVLCIQDIKNNLPLEIDTQTENKILPASLYKLPSIRAGRGFHWEKQISITVEGELEIKVVDGCLFVINHIPLEKYIICVATSEMSGECPPALLESQTVAARSWLLAAAEQKHADLGIDSCNDDCCQRYQGIENLTDAAISAAKKTWGQVLIHEEKICDTRYAKSCGGISENNENVWDDEAKPYLRSVYDGKDASIPNLQSESDLKKWMIEIPNSYCSPNFVRETHLQKYLGHVDKSGSYFRWDVSFSQADLTKLISEKTGRNFDSIQSLQPLNRGISGRITQLRIDGIYKNENSHIILKSEYEIRCVLHPNFLFSSAFIIEANSTANSLASRFIFKGAGWGHGVGLCQIGALGMALNGSSFEKILSHYFHSTKLKNIYD